ncbi:MAG: hypothetical protein K0Q71_2129 [Thermomicrobiales bacterium]|nr:hypothetical protein [Thermomicrobiales bacterium]
MLIVYGVFAVFAAVVVLIVVSACGSPRRRRSVPGSRRREGAASADPTVYLDSGLFTDYSAPADCGPADCGGDFGGDCGCSGGGE